MTEERERLHEVYDHYRRDASVRARWSLDNPGNRALLRERSAAVEALLAPWWRHAPGRARRVLDLGCGARTFVAASLDEAPETVVTRIGADLLYERTVDARDSQTFLEVLCADGSRLPLVDDSFDLVVMFTVLSSVGDPSVATAIGREVTRILRPGGALLWYDVRYRNPANRELRPLRRREVEALFPTLHAEWRTVTLLPPLARRLGPATGVLYPALRAAPPLRSHLLGLLRKPG